MSQSNSDSFNPGAMLVGIIFVVLGALFLLDALDVTNIRRDIVWPAVIIALGAALVISAFWRDRG
jgi:amino acid permease